MARSRHLPAAACVVAIILLAAALTACGSKGQGSTSATPMGSSPPASQSPSATPTTPAIAATSLPPAPVGAAVPTGFRATSVTFVSTDEGFVLGTAPGHGAVVARSRDRGATWTRRAAPFVDIGWPQSQSGSAAGVWGIRFATATHGFVFGRGLWETTDGGATWTRVAAPAGSVLSLAAIDGQVLALVQPSPSSQSATLLRRPLVGGSWTKITTTKLYTTVDPTDLISTQAGTAAVLASGGVLVTRNGGLTFHTYPAPSTASLAPAAVGVTSAGSLALLDGGGAAAGSVEKLVYVSANGGATWTKAGAPSPGGDPVTIAGGSPATLLVGAASGGSEIY
ncbi:MAG: hypothetical protein ABR941_09565, partial [Thermoleophilia bacterium]